MSSEPDSGTPFLTFPKIISFFAAILLVSLGLCGIEAKWSAEEFGGTWGLLGFAGSIIGGLGLLGTGTAATVSWFTKIRDSRKKKP